MTERRTADRFPGILVADDSPTSLQFLTSFLTEQGYSVHPACDGEQVLEFVRTSIPDLILLDVRMPGLDGFEVCRRLKGDERTRSIPVIFISVLEDVRDKVRGFEVGAIDYITKPFQPGEVRARIRTHLRLHELTEQLEQEIVERRRTEQRLQESEERLQLTLEATGVGIWDWDVPKDLWYASPEYYAQLGYEPRTDPGDREEWLERVHPDDQALVRERIQGVLAQHVEDHQYEARLRAADGTYRWMMVRGFCVAHDRDGNVTRMLGIRVDITDRKQAEDEIRKLNEQLEARVIERTAQLEASSKELETFVYSVSHDLRTPLRAIDGYRGLLERRMDGALDDESRRYMEVISRAATRMGMLIDDLLSFSRMGRFEMAKQPVDLGRLVQATIEELSPDAVGREVHWKIPVLPMVFGDRLMLRIVLVNLLANALKFTRPRPVAEIEIGCRDEADETVILVRDNGVGFDMQYEDKLFGVFQRLHGVDEFEGTGIGLANVRRIVQRHGGRCWAEGKVDAGATFYFSLPRAGTDP